MGGKEGSGSKELNENSLAVEHSIQSNSMVGSVRLFSTRSGKPLIVTRRMWEVGLLKPKN